MYGACSSEKSGVRSAARSELCARERLRSDGKEWSAAPSTRTPAREVAPSSKWSAVTEVGISVGRKASASSKAAVGPAAHSGPCPLARWPKEAAAEAAAEGQLSWRRTVLGVSGGPWKLRELSCWWLASRSGSC